MGLDAVAQGNLSADEYMEKLDEFIRVRFNNVVNLNNTGQMIGYYNYVAQFYK